MRCLALAALALSASCAPHPGRLLVVVDTDLPVPTPLGELNVRVARTDGAGAEVRPFTLNATSDVPLSFAVAPRGVATDVEIRVDGYAAGALICDEPGLPVGCVAPLVSRRVVTGFVGGSTRVLRIFLADSCVGVSCPDGEACDRGACTSVTRIDPETLPVAREPQAELRDPSPVRDAGDGRDAAKPTCPGDWWDRRWSRRTMYSVVGVTTELVDFPALVRLGPTTFEYSASADGDDLRFVSPDGTVLAHEVDTWRPDGESLVWVSIPNWRVGTSFALYYEGPPVREERPAEVWRAEEAVLHLPVLVDAAMRGTVVSTGPAPPNSAAGIVGEAADFDGLTQRFSFSTDGLDVTDPITVSLWVFAGPRANGSARIIERTGHFAIRYPASRVPEFRASGLSVVAPGPLAAGRWYHLALTFGSVAGSDGVLRAYVDGVAVGSSPGPRAASASSTVSVGALASGAEAFEGRVDELRISDRERPAAWFAEEIAVVNGDRVAVGRPDECR